jgi:hypothetical protein
VVAEVVDVRGLDAARDDDRAVSSCLDPSSKHDRDVTQARSELERQLDDLRMGKASSADPSRFDAEIEKILLELAQLSRQLRKD